MLGTATAARAIATFEMAVPNAAHRVQAIGAMPAAAPIGLVGRGGRGGRGTGRGRARVG